MCDENLDVIELTNLDTNNLVGTLPAELGIALHLAES
jgi:hypothetical protein